MGKKKRRTDSRLDSWGTKPISQGFVYVSWVTPKTTTRKDGPSCRGQSIVTRNVFFPSRSSKSGRSSGHLLVKDSENVSPRLNITGFLLDVVNWTGRKRGGFCVTLGVVEKAVESMILSYDCIQSKCNAQIRKWSSQKLKEEGLQKCWRGWCWQRKILLWSCPVDISQFGRRPISSTAKHPTRITEDIFRKRCKKYFLI